jgi:hypothetical protein
MNFGGWLGLSIQDGTFGDSQRHGTRAAPTGLSLPQNDPGSRSGIVHALPSRDRIRGPNYARLTVARAAINGVLAGSSPTTCCSRERRRTESRTSRAVRRGSSSDRSAGWRTISSVTVRDRATCRTERPCPMQITASAPISDWAHAETRRDPDAMISKFPSIEEIQVVVADGTVGRFSRSRFLE